MRLPQGWRPHDRHIMPVVFAFCNSTERVEMSVLDACRALDTGLIMTNNTYYDYTRTVKWNQVADYFVIHAFAYNPDNPDYPLHQLTVKRAVWNHADGFDSKVWKRCDFSNFTDGWIQFGMHSYPHDYAPKPMTMHDYRTKQYYIYAGYYKGRGDDDHVAYSYLGWGEEQITVLFRGGIANKNVVTALLHREKYGRLSAAHFSLFII